MNILVTGAAGRIGRAISVRLRAGGHRVVGFDARPGANVDHVGDVTDSASLERALRGTEAVVHVAALHAPHVGARSDHDFERVNVAATADLVGLMRRAGIPRLVFTSTTALYGAELSAGRAAWIDEDTVPAPRTIYHRTKLAAERLLEQAVMEGDLSIAVLRMARCFPEPAPLMAAYRLHRGIDARDVADAHALALASAGPGLRRFVISGPTPFRREDAAILATDASAVLRVRAPALVEAFVRRAWPLPRSIDRVYDPGRAQRELGWTPRYGYESVIAQMDEGSPEVLPP